MIFHGVGKIFTMGEWGKGTSILMKILMMCFGPWVKLGNPVLSLFINGLNKESITSGSRKPRFLQKFKFSGGILHQLLSWQERTCENIRVWDSASVPFVIKLKRPNTCSSFVNCDSHVVWAFGGVLGSAVGIWCYPNSGFYMFTIFVLCWVTWIVYNRVTSENLVVRSPLDIVFTLWPLLLY